MNIAMISYHTCPLATLGGKDTGGMNVYVAELTRFLGKAGVHVDVFTRSQDEHVPHVLHNLGHGNRVVHIPAGPEIPLPKKELASYIPEFVEGILKFTQSKDLHYDIIHSHYWMSGVAAEQLKAVWKIPIIHMYHTLVLMKNRIARSPEETEGEYRLAGERQILQIADRIVAATPAEQSQLEFLYRADSKKLRVVPPGVDLSRFYPIPRDEARDGVAHRPVPFVVEKSGRRRVAGDLRDVNGVAVTVGTAAGVVLVSLEAAHGRGTARRDGDGTRYRGRSWGARPGRGRRWSRARGGRSRAAIIADNSQVPGDLLVVTRLIGSTLDEEINLVNIINFIFLVYSLADKFTVGNHRGPLVRPVTKIAAPCPFFGELRPRAARA